MAWYGDVCTSGKFVTVHESYRKLHLSGDNTFSSVCQM